MRRAIALLFAIVLVGSLASSSLAVESNPVDKFTGKFVELSRVDGSVVGTVVADFKRATDKELVPGYEDFYGVSGEPGTWVPESHVNLSFVDFWHDPGWEGGSNVAFAEGWGCSYFAPEVTMCGEFAYLFIDVLDPSIPDQFRFATQRVGPGHNSVYWNWLPGRWYDVGEGSFVLRYTGS